MLAAFEGGRVLGISSKDMGWSKTNKDMMNLYIYIVLFTSVKPLPGLLAPPPE